MNQLKTRLQGLALLDRAFTAMTDEELQAAIDALPDDHRDALDKIAGARDGAFTDPASRLIALRSTAARGRMNGGLEQVTTLLADACLADCVEALGDHADEPTEAQFLEVAPGLIERNGRPIVRVMMAASVAGEAAAAATLARLLKHDETLALPAEPELPAVVLAPREAPDDVKARRKAVKDAKKADARARREQQARARNRT